MVLVSVGPCSAAMASSKKKSCLYIPFLLILLLVSAVHGAQPADARDATAAAAGGGDGERVTVRTGHGHGYSGHSSGGHTSGGTAEQGGGAGDVVDPRNLNARSHHRSGAASIAVYSLVVCGLAGAILAVVLA